jgi:Ser/Thr protein kinase RdoA (MazF antagonist)
MPGKEYKMITLLSNWGLENARIVSRHSNVWKVDSGKSTFYLKRRTQTSIFERWEEFQVTQYLVGNGVFAETPILTENGAPFIIWEDSFYSLYASLNGDSLQHFHMITPDQCYIIGGYLGRCHQVLMTYPVKEKTAVWDVFGHMEGWLSIGQTELKEWAVKVYNSIVSLEEYVQMPYQLVHSDVHLGNFIWGEHEISGLVDFERIRRSPRIADVSYFITGLLRNSFTDGDAGGLFNKINLFLKGYSWRQMLDEKEFISLYPLIMLFLLQYTLFYSFNGFLKEASSMETLVCSLSDRKEFMESLTDL